MSSITLAVPASLEALLKLTPSMSSLHTPRRGGEGRGQGRSATGDHTQVEGHRPACEANSPLGSCDLNSSGLRFSHLQMREEGPLPKALGMLNESSLYLKNLDPPFRGDTGHRTVLKMAPSHSPDTAATAPTASHSEDGEDGKCPSSALAGILPKPWSH